MPVKCLVRFLSVFFMVLAWMSPAFSTEWIFEKVVDSDTRVPGKEVTFLAFSLYPSLDNGNIAFYASYHNSDGELRVGIYAHVNGVLRLVADKETQVPGSTGVFQNLDMWPSMGGTGVAFAGSELPAYFNPTGVYKGLSEQLQVVANADTPIPDGTGNFNAMLRHGVSADGAVVAFYGKGEGDQSGIYVEEGGVLKKVADETTAIPQGTGNFTEFESSTAISSTQQAEGIVAFLGRGQGGQEGIYKRVGSVLMKVADKNTPIPGGGGNFAEFGAPFSVSDGNVAFWATGNGGGGAIFKEVDGVLFKVADTNTPIPEGNGTFADFFRKAVSIYGRCVVFTGRDNEDRSGVYTDCSGELRKVIDEDDTLDGKSFCGVSAARESFDDGCIAFKVDFDDFSNGVYLARPTPAVVPTVTPWGVAVFILLAGLAGVWGIKRLKVEN